MLNGKPVHAIVPARAGSKGIPGKNLYRLGKDTLLERAIKLARMSSHVDSVWVSTDDPEMYRIAQRHDAASGGLRPAHLADDSALTVDVIRHVMQETGIEDAYILLLQTTSPLRTLADLEKLCATFTAMAGEAEAMVSVTRHLDPHPDKMQRIVGGYIQSYLGGSGGAPRQTLPEVYRLNGAFYLVHSDIVAEQRTLLPARTLPFIMPEERSVNLDSHLDLVLLEALVEKGVVVLEEY